MDGILFDVQRFSVHDGPGIRTTFFLKGCPLRCKWCHNPEGMERRMQLRYEEESCIGCADCVSVCKNQVHTVSETAHQVDFGKCSLCGECVKACPSAALTVVGNRLTPQEVLSLALKDRAFYGEKGGVTFSGGEASQQWEFLCEALRLCKAENINTAVDTCGFMKEEVLAEIMKYCDLFLYDIKAVSPDIHKNGTGADNLQILNNFRYLLKNSARVWVRIPLIGGFNANCDEMEKIALFLSENRGAEQIELIPYHKLGRGKYSQIGLEKPDDTLFGVTAQQREKFKDILRGYSLPLREDERRSDYGQN